MVTDGVKGGVVDKIGIRFMVLVLISRWGLVGIWVRTEFGVSVGVHVGFMFMRIQVRIRFGFVVRTEFGFGFEV